MSYKYDLSSTWRTILSSASFSLESHLHFYKVLSCKSSRLTNIHSSIWEILVSVAVTSTILIPEITRALPTNPLSSNEFNMHFWVFSIYDHFAKVCHQTLNNGILWVYPYIALQREREMDITSGDWPYDTVWPYRECYLIPRKKGQVLIIQNLKVSNLLALEKFCHLNSSLKTTLGIMETFLNLRMICKLQMWGHLSTFTYQSRPRVHATFSNSGRPEMTILGKGSLSLQTAWICLYN